MQLAGAAAAALLVVGTTAVAAPPQKKGAAAAQRTVTIEATAFSPVDTTLKVGDTITWVNRDPFPHTATARGAFDSNTIRAGKSWTWRATKTGEFAYVCAFHPTMKGRVRVE
jgi:plastocyanin